MADLSGVHVTGGWIDEMREWLDRIPPDDNEWALANATAAQACATAALVEEQRIANKIAYLSLESQAGYPNAHLRTELFGGR